MKKIIIAALGIVLVCVGFYFVFFTKDQEEIVVLKKNERSVYLDEYLKSEWINVLPEYEWNDIEKDDESYKYIYEEESVNNSKINKSVEYTKTAEEEYQGSMKIAFSGDADSYVVNVPKSFASHVDEINFSHEPSNVINPDPIVEFKKSDSDIEIESKEVKMSDDIERELEEQIFESESRRCDELQGDEGVACALSLISKYRHSKYLEDEISKIDMSEVSGASVVAVFNGSMRSCKYVKDSKDRQKCYEYTYQILVDECHKSDGKEYRTCVRNLSSELPSFEEQRLFCGHIDDEEMRKECQGVAPLETCDEIDNAEKRDMCKLNIVRTNGDIDACKKIENPDYKDVCVAIVGINKNDESYCEKIEDKYIRGQCLAKLGMQLNDKTVCDKIAHEDSRDICYAHFIAQQDVDQGMCNGINELFLKETCEMMLAMNNKDIAKCMDPKIVNYENQAICLAGIGMKHGDADVCGKIDITYGEFEEDRILQGMIRDLCYATVVAKNGDKNICKKIIDAKLKKGCEDGELKKKNNEDVTSEAPQLPEWMDCPIPENAKSQSTSNSAGSVLKYTDPNDDKKIVGPNIRYRNPDFSDPHLLFCYNSDGQKHGAFKEYDKDTGNIRREGYFKNGEWDQLVTLYINGVIRSKVMYDEGVKQGLGEDYCTNEACGLGTLAAKGQYVDDKKQGVWQYYKNGNPTKAGTYDKGHNVSK